MDRADRAYTLAILVGLFFVILLGPLERRLELVSVNDFSGVWAGARAIVIGADPYAPEGWIDLTRAMGTQEPNTRVYGYTPWVAIALLPLALLPLQTAAWLWMAAGFAVGALALRALLRSFLPGRTLLHALAGLALFMSQPAVHSSVLGQWSFVLLGATTLGILGLRAGRPAAGAALVAFLAKPQLFILASLGLLRDGTARGWRGRAFVAAAAAAGLLTVTVGWVALPHWLDAWLAHVVPVRLERSASLSSALADLIGPAGPPLALAATVVMVAVALAFRAGTDEALAVWLALSLACAPYVWSYDHLLLLVPLTIGSGALARRDARTAGAVFVAGLLTLVLVSTALYGIAVLRHRESFSAAVPLAFFVALAISLWPARRGRLSAAARAAR